jgi:hypothetical protein
MAEDEVTGYRVTYTGNVTAYRITQTGMFRITYTQDSPPPPVPAGLIPILRVREMIYDPQAKDIVYVGQLPSFPLPGIAFTLGDGVYRARPGDAWIPLDTKFTDAGIEDMLAMAGKPVRAACLLIDRLIARIQPDDYITSGNAGGQSVGFPSLADMLAFYRGLKADLLAEAAAMEGTDTGRFFTVERPAVGGVWEN